MSANKGKKNSALVPREPRAIEKYEPGAKRVLALMVSDTLAIAQKYLAPAPTSPKEAELENWFQQGCKHYFGEGVPKYYMEAVRWFRLAAEQGHADAQDTLGNCYAQLRRLYETLQLEIINVLESLGRLRESPDYELCRISEKKPAILDEVALEQAKLLEKESAELEDQANRFAEEIKELGGEKPSRIC